MIAFGAMLDNEKNESKFYRINEMYKHVVFSVAYDITKNYHDAEDVMSDTWLKIISMINNIDESSIGTKRCKNLIITITKNTAIDLLRKKKYEKEAIKKLDVHYTAAGMEERIIHIEQLREAISLINELDEKYREVLYLRVLYELPAKKAGALLNISEDSVNMRFMRAKRMLVKRLKEREQMNNRQGLTVKER